MNKQTKQSLTVTIFHAVELLLSAVVALAFAYVLKKLGAPLDLDMTALIGTVFINALLKFQRSTPEGMLNDYTRP